MFMVLEPVIESVNLVMKLFMVLDLVLALFIVAVVKMLISTQVFSNHYEVLSTCFWADILTIYTCLFLGLF
jgi:hypothetical protein